MEKKFRSTKTYTQIAPCAYRQWKSDTHCNQIHGYSFSFRFDFECDDLDARNWCMDYGGLRVLKDKLEEWFDHKTLVAQDDPHIDWYREAQKRGIMTITEVERTGCEGLADFLYKYVNGIMLPSFGEVEAARVWCCSVQVQETNANMAMRNGHRSDNEELF